MPTIKENKNQFNDNYEWPNYGEEWSVSYGGASMQWYGSILPRIHQHVPAYRILEIACGYGRWTQYLKNMCKKLIVIDISEKCIQYCKKRFSGESHIEYFVNDGKSLDMIPDASLDFVFSFDSLVHADESVMKAYLCQLQRVMNIEGVAFIHHSNLGEYYTGRKNHIIPQINSLLRLKEFNLHWRDPSVDATKVQVWTEKYGLKCISQEIVPCEKGQMFIDCMSTIVRENSKLSRDNRILRNKIFLKEAQNLLQLSKLYITTEK